MRKWVTYHGISLNLAPDLSHYDAIVPCGLDPRVEPVGALNAHPHPTRTTPLHPPKPHAHPLTRTTHHAPHPPPPSRRYAFAHPQETGHATCPFHAVWCCGGWATERQRKEAVPTHTYYLLLPSTY